MIYREILRGEGAVKRWRIQSRSGATVVVDANATEPGLTRTCTPLYRRVNLEARHHPLSVVSNSPHEMHCSDASCRYNAGSSNPLDYSALLDTRAPCVVEVLRSNTHADHAAKRPLYSGDSDGDSELPWCADFTCVPKNPGKRLVSIDLQILGDTGGELAALLDLGQQRFCNAPFSQWIDQQIRRC